MAVVNRLSTRRRSSFSASRRKCFSLFFHPANVPRGRGVSHSRHLSSDTYASRFYTYRCYIHSMYNGRIGTYNSCSIIFTILSLPAGIPICHGSFCARCVVVNRPTESVDYYYYMYAFRNSATENHSRVLCIPPYHVYYVIIRCTVVALILYYEIHVHTLYTPVIAI